MKQCPECRELFDDGVRFCEMHGAELLDVDDTSDLREALIQSTNRGTTMSAAGVLGTALIGLLVGVVLTLLAYAIFLAPSSTNTADQKSESKGQLATRSSQVVAAPAPERPVEAPSPAEEIEEEPSPSPSPSPTAVATAEPPSVAMNNGPISTGVKRTGETGQALIKMKDGSSVEADAAWEDSQGIWYRRRGLVSFVERSKVEKITELAEPRAATAETPKH